MSLALTLIKRDLRLSMARGSEGAVALFFFALVAVLFAFAFGGDAALLKRAAGGIIWVAALLSALLSLEGIWHRDFEDGTFDLLMLSPVSPMAVVMAKVFAHWMLSGLPIVAGAALLSQMLFLPATVLPVLLLSLMGGTLYMSLLGGMGAVMTLGARRPGMLMAVIVLPLYIPMLILGVLSLEGFLAAQPVAPYVIWQAVLLLLALPLAPFAAAAFLKTHLRSS